MSHMSKVYDLKDKVHVAESYIWQKHALFLFHEDIETSSNAQLGWITLSATPWSSMKHVYSQITVEGEEIII